MTPWPWIECLSPSFFKRLPHIFPMQGEHDPWTNPQSHAATLRLLINHTLAYGVLVLR